MGTGVSKQSISSARKNSTGSIFRRSRLNLIEGTNVTLTVADDPTNGEIDVTISSSGAGSGTFLGLTDTPSSYTGQALKIARVNAGETAMEFAAATGTGTVTDVSVTTANGVSGSVATSTTTPAISLTLGAITPTSVNSVVLSGSATPTLAVTGTTAVSGTNTGDVANTALTTGTLAQFAATTSAQLAGVISDETGSGSLVFGTSPTLTTPLISGGTLGSVYFAGASGLITQDNANFFWDDTNNRLGVGTTVPTTQIDIMQSAHGAGFIMHGFTGHTTDTVSINVDSGGGGQIYATNGRGLSLQSSSAPGGATAWLSLCGGTNAQTSGANPTVLIQPTYNQASGTASNTDLKINRTETALGSGTQLLVDAQVGGTSYFSIDNKGGVTITQKIVTTGSPNLLKVTGAAHTTLTASTEAIDANFNFARTVQFATGALTTQRSTLFQAPTYGFFGASTITTAATLAISGAPAAGTNATITTSLALWVQGGDVQFSGTNHIYNGANPIQKVAGTASATQGLIMQGNITAAGSGAEFTIRGTTTRTAGNLLAVQNNVTSKFVVAWDAGTTLTQSVNTTGAPALLTLTGAAHTTLTAAGSFTDITFDLAQIKQMATGAVTFAKVINIKAPTLAFVGASTVTDAATLYISGAPAAGTNATITSPYAFYSASGLNAFGGDVRFLQQSTEFLVYGTQTATTYLIFRGNQSAAGTGSDVRIGTSATRTAGYILQLSNVNTVRAQFDYTGGLEIAQGAGATGSLFCEKITSAPHTNQTLSTEAPEIVWNLSAIKQFATGALTDQRSIKINAPTYSFVGVSTITRATTLYIDKAPSAGTNATITDKYALWVNADSSRFDGRILEAKGADVASASTLTLGSDGNFFTVTGTTTVNYITTTGWTAGSYAVLFFTGSLTIAHNTGTVPGGTAALLLSGAVNYAATANDSLSLVYNGTNWVEIGRTVI